VSGRSLRARGFTLIELLVVISVIGTLLAIAVPRYFRSIERSKETVLRQDLSVMRQAIDQHRADRGEYPDSLEALVDHGYLREVPEDPFTKSAGTWVVESSREPEVSGVADVRSGAEGVGYSGVPLEEY